MSQARQQFLDDVEGIRAALALEPMTAGAATPQGTTAVVVLRRGIIIAGFIALETFIRARTVEVVEALGSWAASYDDFPPKFRDAALLNAVGNLQKYALMMKRQGEDYNKEIVDEIRLMAKTDGPVYGFSRHIAGDYTGNISVTTVKDLLAAFGVKDCWNVFRHILSDLGYGVPSVEEVLRSLTSKRHRSAHVASFRPTISDTANLADHLTCIGLCVDLALSSSVRRAGFSFREWADDSVSWRESARLFTVDQAGPRLRLSRVGQRRALRLVGDMRAARQALPAVAAGEIIVLVQRDIQLIPTWWTVVA